MSLAPGLNFRLRGSTSRVRGRAEKKSGHFMAALKFYYAVRGPEEPLFHDSLVIGSGCDAPQKWNMGIFIERKVARKKTLVQVFPSFCIRPENH